MRTLLPIVLLMCCNFINLHFIYSAEPYLSVTAFGAKGNGTTDDTRAIQNAINSAKGILYFPPGAYIISKGLVVNSDNLVLMGSGKNTASMLVSTNFTDAITLNGMRCTVDGLAVDGNKRCRDGIVIKGTQSEVANCIIQNCRGNGIAAPYVQSQNHNKNIRNCKVYTCKQAGILVSSNDMYIRDCEIANNEGDQQVVLAGANNRIFNCHIWSGDQFTTNSKTSGVEIRGDGFQIQGCVFDRNNRYGININPNPSQYIDSGIICGNWFYQNGSDIHFSVTRPRIIVANNVTNP